MFILITSLNLDTQKAKGNKICEITVMNVKLLTAIVIKMIVNYEKGYSIHLFSNV